MDVKQFGFSRKERLNNTAVFNYVLKNGEKTIHPFFYLYFIHNNLLFNRLGIRVSKKFGSAPDRNKAKRVIREVFRKNKSLLKGFDLVFIPRYGNKSIFFEWEIAVKKILIEIDNTEKLKLVF